MRQFTVGEKKLVDIMEKYGTIMTSIDAGGMEGCSFEGNIRAKGNTWMYIGYGVGPTYDGDTGMSPIDETYLALNEIVWAHVKDLTGQ